MPRETPLSYSTEMILAMLEVPPRKSKTRRIPSNRLPNVDDIVWAREAWRVGAWNENGVSITVDYRADNHPRKEWIDIANEWSFERLRIQCSDDAERAGRIADGDGQYHWEPGDSPHRWRLGRFMFKNAARIWLRVTDKRLEPLQAITYEDILAEGWNPQTSEPITEETAGEDARAWFIAAWNSLHYANPRARWEENPEVAVIGYEIISTEGRPE